MIRSLLVAIFLTKLKVATTSRSLRGNPIANRPIAELTKPQAIQQHYEAKAELVQGLSALRNQTLLNMLKAKNTAAQEMKVYIIRHGEKKGLVGCLDEVGKHRATAIPQRFTRGGKFHTPGAIYAMKYHDGFDCERTLETVTPIAALLGLQVNNSYSAHPWISSNPVAAQAILREMIELNGKPVLVAWEHANIPFLTRALGVPPEEVYDWSSDDYDSVFELTYTKGGPRSLKLQSYKVKAQGLGNGRSFLPGPKAGATLNPSFQGVPCMPWERCDVAAYTTSNDISIVSQL